MSDASRVKKILRSIPNNPGVYLMKSRIGSIIYIGKAINLKKRVTSYFQRSGKTIIDQPKVTAMVELIHDIDYIETANEAEALILESKLIKKWKPKYNTILKDDKRFLLIKVSYQNILPIFSLARLYKRDNSRYFGPFTQPNLVRNTLKEIRKKFGVLLGDTYPKEIKPGVYRLYDDARSEIYGAHKNEVDIEAYRSRVDAACKFLEGRSKEWICEIEEKMQAASANMQYEKAAHLRDILVGLRKTIEHNRKFIKDPDVPLNTNQAQRVLKSLQQILQLPNIPNHIECFDISHISGTFTVASMVQFTNGMADKKQYRHYKIQSFEGNDDYRSMEEAVYRRYSRLLNQEKPLPDLLVIDGGKGQIRAAQKAFIILQAEPPPIIGLAKKHEHIIFPDTRQTLKLSLDSSELKLLQRIRDEAHRFANSFNNELRLKRIRESVLDDLKGLGKNKKTALLTHFKEISKLKKASIKDLCLVEGIGPKTAQLIFDFLKTL